MKKLLLVIAVLAMVAMGTVVAYADETDSNMTSDVFLELRLEQIDEALAAGTITQEQAELLIAHITERAEEGIFGYRGTNEECVLGDELQGIFRNANSGMRNGEGRGVKANDGTGLRQGGNGQSRGGQGVRNGSCLVE
ncbi:MAG: hypothetical protein JXR88_00735 [Clostridia bacterium]|nr:hypothetical protein [Clostridia bacterium]